MTYNPLSFHRRTCWVCFCNDEDEPGLEWTSPCKCNGTTKWVHQLCLQHWIDEKQRMGSSVEVSCPQCQFVYQIQYPSANMILMVYEITNRAVTFSSPMLLAGLTASSLYWISFTYGVTAATVALGRERSIEFFSNPESSLAVVLLPLLPWAIMGFKLFRLEVRIWMMWYRYLHPALCTFLKVFPLTKRFARTTVNQPRDFQPVPVAALPFFSRALMGTFFLPMISSLLGWMLSRIVHTSQLKRTLMVSEHGCFSSLSPSFSLIIHLRVL